MPVEKTRGSGQLLAESARNGNNQLTEAVEPRYRSAISAYLSLHSNEERERVSDLLGIDEYA